MLSVTNNYVKHQENKILFWESSIYFNMVSETAMSAVSQGMPDVYIMLFCHGKKPQGVM